MNHKDILSAWRNESIEDVYKIFEILNGKQYYSENSIRVYLVSCIISHLPESMEKYRTTLWCKIRKEMDRIRNIENNSTLIIEFEKFLNNMKLAIDVKHSERKYNQQSETGFASL